MDFDHSDSEPMHIKSEYHTNLLDAQCDSETMPGRGSQDALFDRLSWHRNLVKYCLDSSETLLPFVSRNDGAQCWLPLKKDRFFQYSALANWYNFTFRPIFSGADDEVTKLALLSHLAKKLTRKMHRITLSPVPDEDDSGTLTVRAFRQAGWVVIRQQCDENHILAVDGRSFDEYWKARPGQLRSTVKRKAKKNDVAIRIETEFTNECWADYIKVYQRSWKPEEGSPDFLKHLAQQEAKAGCLRLGLAYIDGKPVAAQLWTSENGIALIHKLAHDERALKASPGTLLSAALFQYVIDVDRVDLIDFGTGNDRYKSDWMEEIRPRYRLDMFWPHNPMSWPYIAKHWISGLVAKRRNR